jgi:hypothetical protein
MMPFCFFAMSIKVDRIIILKNPNPKGVNFLFIKYFFFLDLLEIEKCKEIHSIVFEINSKFLIS